MIYFTYSHYISGRTAPMSVIVVWFLSELACEPHRGHGIISLFYFATMGSETQAQSEKKCKET